MSFGLKNARVTYQRMMNKMFTPKIGRNIEVYVDDMIVKSRFAQTHLADLIKTFRTLQEFDMHLNPAKCAFGVSSRKFIGFIIHMRGIDANLEKIQAIIDMQPPRSVKETQCLTGRLTALARFLS